MRAVVCDTSPICYLLLIEEIELLPALYGRIHIPAAVAVELRHPDAPAPVRNWIGDPPDWVEVHSNPAKTVPVLRGLQAGERDALGLAEEVGAVLVILDDLKARKAAKARGLNVIGLLGVLGRAAEKKLIFLPEALARLQRTNFRTGPRVLEELLERYRRGSS